MPFQTLEVDASNMSIGEPALVTEKTNALPKGWSFISDTGAMTHAPTANASFAPVAKPSMGKTASFPTFDFPALDTSNMTVKINGVEQAPHVETLGDALLDLPNDLNRAVRSYSDGSAIDFGINGAADWGDWSGVGDWFGGIGDTVADLFHDATAWLGGSFVVSMFGHFLPMILAGVVIRFLFKTVTNTVRMPVSLRQYRVDTKNAQSAIMHLQSNGVIVRNVQTADNYTHFGVPIYHSGKAERALAGFTSAKIERL